MSPEDVEAFRIRARRWLEANAEAKAQDDDGFTWGEGSDSVALFHNLTAAEERATSTPTGRGSSARPTPARQPHLGDANGAGRA